MARLRGVLGGVKSVVLSLPFLIWLFIDLRVLREIRRDIVRHRAAGDGESERREILRATTLWGRRVCDRLRVRLLTEGATALPDGPVLFVSNHESFADIPVFCRAIEGKAFGFVAKRDLARLPVFGKWIAEIRSLFLDRDDARASLRAMDEAAELLRAGFSLVVFPEGTRSRSDDMGAFRKGSLRAAVKAGVPVVPVTLMGTWRFLEAHDRVDRGHTVRFRVHEPIPTAGLSRAEAARLAETVEAVVRGRLDVWRAEGADGTFRAKSIAPGAEKM